MSTGYVGPRGRVWWGPTAAGEIGGKGWMAEGRVFMYWCRRLERVGRDVDGSGAECREE